MRLDMEGLLDGEAELGLLAADSCDSCASGVPLRLFPADEEVGPILF